MYSNTHLDSCETVPLSNYISLSPSIRRQFRSVGWSVGTRSSFVNGRWVGGLVGQSVGKLMRPFAKQSICGVA